MTARRIAFWMLTTAGVAVGHIVGYAVAHPDGAAREAALGGHAYLPVAASVAVPLGVGASLWWAVRTARQLGLSGRIDVRQLVVAQLALFAVQEVAERVGTGAGVGAVLAERGVWFGLLAQILVAVAIVRSVDVVRRVVRFVTGARRRPADRLRPAAPVELRTLVRRVRAAVAVGLRAPPAVGSSC